VVMALFLLLCPLARHPHHAQQPQGAEYTGRPRPDEAASSGF
jgi:hypothetical protein